jgi:8-oxo-dGTP diphosphatase
MSEKNIGVTIIVINPVTKKTLIGKRKNAYKAGYWGFPGGRVNLGETLVHAARRELKEETDLKSINLK